MAKSTPVLAGVNGTDPFCQFDSFLDELARKGFAGVQNFPTVHFIDGKLRQNLEETGMGYDGAVNTHINRLRLKIERDPTELERVLAA